MVVSRQLKSGISWEEARNMLIQPPVATPRAVLLAYYVPTFEIGTTTEKIKNLGRQALRGPMVIEFWNWLPRIVITNILLGPALSQHVDYELHSQPGALDVVGLPVKIDGSRTIRSVQDPCGSGFTILSSFDQFWHRNGVVSSSGSTSRQ